MKRSMNDGLVAGFDLSVRESMVALVSPTCGVCERFSFRMDEDGYSLLASRIPKDAKIAFEASGMAYPFHRALRRSGYGDVTVAAGGVATCMKNQVFRRYGSIVADAY